MGVLIHLACQIFDFLVSQAVVVGVEDGIFVRCARQHTFLFAMATIYFFQALFYRLWTCSTRLINICRDAKIGAPGRPDNTT